MKRKTWQKWFISAVSACACLTVLPAQAADLLDEILSRGVLRVAVPADYPPFGFVGPDMKAQGLDIDMANLIGEKLGVKVALVPVILPNRIPSLQTGKVDLVISSLTKSAERTKVIDFSIAYSPFFDGVFGAKALQVTTYDDLTGKSIAIVRGTLHDQQLQNLAPLAVLKRYEDINNTVSAFLSGQTELLVEGTPVVAALLRRNPNLDIEMKMVLSNTPNHVAMRKGHPRLIAKVNDIIREAKKNGTLDALSIRWMGAPTGELPE